MKEKIKVQRAEEYFAKTNRKVNYDFDHTFFDEQTISSVQAELINDILAVEMGIIATLENEIIDPLVSSELVLIRNRMIYDYEQRYEKYVLYNTLV
jgi:hypothetical protein